MNNPPNVDSSTPKFPAWSYNRQLFRARVLKAARAAKRATLRFWLAFFYHSQHQGVQQATDISPQLGVPVVSGWGTDPASQAPITDSASQARDVFPSHDSNREDSPPVSNDDFTRFLKESEQREFQGLLHGICPNDNPPVPGSTTPATFPSATAFFADENMDRVAESEDDLANSLAEGDRKLAIEQQVGELGDESTINPISLSSIVASFNSRSSYSGNSYTSVLGCPSICTFHAVRPPSSPVSAPSVPPYEGSITFGRDSVDFVNFSSFTPAGLELDDSQARTRQIAAISPGNVPHIASPHNGRESPTPQRRKPRPVGAVENLREHYLQDGLLQMQEPMLNRGVRSLPESTKCSTSGKQPAEDLQAAHLGMREPIPVSRTNESLSNYSVVDSMQPVLSRPQEGEQAIESSNQLPALLNQGVDFQLFDDSEPWETICPLKMMESLVDRSIAPESGDIEDTPPRAEVTIGNRETQAVIDNRYKEVNPAISHETKIPSRRNAFEEAYDRELPVSQPVSSTGRNDPTPVSTNTILPEPTIELLFHSGLRGRLYRLFLPLTRRSLTRAEYEEARTCINLRQAMRNAEENARKRARQAELKDKRKRKIAKSGYCLLVINEDGAKWVPMA
ncbi:hypothetical protein EV426DRAFT_703745 [Tirmania nivea]|nr:hypothetical protein EV426DRAFT_703745 [Tirmania nivea]